MEALTLHKTEIVGQRAISIIIYAANNAEIYWQWLKPGTDKPWQRRRDIQHFDGELATMKALNAFNKAIKAFKGIL